LRTGLIIVRSNIRSSTEIVVRYQFMTSDYLGNFTFVRVTPRQRLGLRNPVRVRDWHSGRIVEDVGFAMAVISVLGHLRCEAAQFMHFCICGTGCLIICVWCTRYMAIIMGCIHRFVTYLLAVECHCKVPEPSTNNTYVPKRNHVKGGLGMSSSCLPNCLPSVPQP
jgi:hypothetical protein